MCVAVDANAMHAFQIGRLSDVDTAETRALEHILNTTYLALDDQQICVQEWLNCMPGPFGEEVKDWMDLLLNNGKLRYLPAPPCPQITRRCRQGGLPPSDMKWIKLCAHECVDWFLTEDIDFFDPTRKRASAAAKARAKLNRNGPMLRLIRQATGTEVIAFSHVVAMV
jgi:hypothetical protein